MDSGCRLCNSNLMLINILDVPLLDSKQIKKCIEIATGVSIHQDDEMGKFVCKHCCDIAILCYKYRKNAQKNAIRKRDELLKIKKSSLPQSPSTSYRKPGPKSMRNSTYASPSVSNVATIKCNITASTSEILLQYPSLRVPPELYTKNITPRVNIKDIQSEYEIDSDGHVNLRPSGPKQYRITKVNTTKLSLKKFSPQKRRDSFSSSTVDVSDWNDDPGQLSDSSNEPLSQKCPSNVSTPSKVHNNSLKAGSESNLLIPVTYKDQFTCNICNKVCQSKALLGMHRQRKHKVRSDKDHEDSCQESSGVESEKLSSTTATPRIKPQAKKRKVAELERSRDNSEDSSIASCSTNTINIESVRVKSEIVDAVTSQRPFVLKLVRIEEDENLRQNYPNVFNGAQLDTSGCTNNEDAMSISDNNDDEPDELHEPDETAEPAGPAGPSEPTDTSIAENFPTPVFKSLWTKGIKPKEKQKLRKNMFGAFLRTRICDKPTKDRKPVVECKHAEVQATTALDAIQFKLDFMGTNEMEVLLPELHLYNVPVSILKQPQNSRMKDLMNAFFIRYSPTETVSKPIDWSKVPKMTLQRHMRHTSTPRSRADSDLNLSASSLPSMIPARDLGGYKRTED